MRCRMPMTTYQLRLELLDGNQHSPNPLAPGLRRCLEPRGSSVLRLVHLQEGKCPQKMQRAAAGRSFDASPDFGNEAGATPKMGLEGTLRKFGSQVGFSKMPESISRNDYHCNRTIGLCEAGSGWDNEREVVCLLQKPCEENVSDPSDLDPSPLDCTASGTQVHTKANRR